MTAVYDSIADLYTSVIPERPLYKHAIYPALYHWIGDVKHKDVLDLATGSGHIAREMSRRGARSVLGIDDSEEMLKIGRSLKTPADRIVYRKGKVGSLGNLPQIYRADVVIGGFLLHYSQTREELFSMVREIATFMAKDGLYVGLNCNPLSSFRQTSTHETVIRPGSTVREGDRMEVRVAGTDLSFPNYHWNWSTYERAFSEAGLIVDWIAIHPTDEGVRLYGDDFWHDVIMHPNVILMRAVKR